MTSSDLALLPLGVGDAFTAKHYSFCLALRAEERWLLVDCPHPIRKMMREGAERAGLSLDVGDIDAVVITHLHADHVSGLEGFAYFSRFVLGRRVKLYAHEDVLARMWAGSLAAGMEVLMRKDGDSYAHEPLSFEDYFDATPLREHEPVEIGPFSVESRRTIHHVPTTALRVRAGAASIGISADTAFDPALIAWLSEADLVVHETNYGVHTPYESLAALPEEIRRKMRLVHYPDDFDTGESAIECLREGRLYRVR